MFIITTGATVAQKKICLPNWNVIGSQTHVCVDLWDQKGVLKNTIFKETVDVIKYTNKTEQVWFLFGHTFYKYFKYVYFEPYDGHAYREANNHYDFITVTLSKKNKTGKQHLPYSFELT